MVTDKVLPNCDAHSKEFHLASRVLGGGKGGQPLDAVQEVTGVVLHIDLGAESAAEWALLRARCASTGSANDLRYHSNVCIFISLNFLNMV